MRAVAQLTLGLASVVAVEAAANPMAYPQIRAVQVPETQHVQLTYCMADFNDVERDVFRDDVEIHLTPWTPLKNYRVNAGSGVRAEKARQACDCQAPLGVHRYEFRPKPAPPSDQPKILGQVGKTHAPPAVSVEVLAKVPKAAAAPKPAKEPSDTPWDDPEPPGVQGLSCAAACKAAAPPPRAAEPLKKQ